MYPAATAAAAGQLVPPRVIRDPPRPSPQQITPNKQGRRAAPASEPSTMRSVLVLVTAAAAVAAGAGAAAGAAELDCPLPGGPETASEETCGQYSACQWTQGRCLLGDEVGYQLDGPPLVIHTGYEAYLNRSENVTMFGADVDRLHVLAVEYDNNRLGVSVGISVQLFQCCRADVSLSVVMFSFQVFFHATGV